MHIRKNHVSVLPPIPTLSDGKTSSFRDCLKIDQFFGSEGTLKDTGFPASDITLLERLQRAGGTPYETLKNHLNPVAPSSVDKRSVKEKLDTVRPAWCQTAAEQLAYDENLRSYYSSRSIESSAAESSAAESAPDGAALAESAPAN